MARLIHGGWRFALLTSIALSSCSSLVAQQKGQYQPGEYGLNAGDLPDPGITYANFTFNYNAGQLNFANGTPVKATGTYNVWAVSNFSFMFLNSRFWVQSSHRLLPSPQWPRALSRCRSWATASPLEPVRLLLRIPGFNWQILVGTCRGLMSGRDTPSTRPPAATLQALRIMSVLVTGATTSAGLAPST